MNARVATTLAALVVAAAVAGTSGAGGGVTITARPLVVAAVISPLYEPLTLSGSIPSRDPDETVTIQANECSFPGWRDVMTAHVGPGGTWSARPSVLTRTTFRARWRATTSRTVTVQTRPGVSIEQSTRTRWSVGVLAMRSYLGRIGLLQRYDRRAARWRTVKRFRLTERVRAGQSTWTYARFRARVPARSTVRAVIPRSQVRPCYLAGYSLLLPAR
ncbi:MAG: hypothetical protein M3123_03925 [Actinomycetota bacterium]|nr:hypothetical protein [Actinomycetota bacterium]